MGMSPVMAGVLHNKHLQDLEETEGGILVDPAVKDPLLTAQCLREAIPCAFVANDPIVLRYKAGHVEHALFVSCLGGLLIVKTRAPGAERGAWPDYGRCFIDILDLAAVYEG